MKLIDKKKKKNWVSFPTINGLTSFPNWPKLSQRFNWALGITSYRLRKGISVTTDNTFGFIKCSSHSYMDFTN